MPKQRGNGDGAVYQRESDKRWVAVLRLGPGQKMHMYGKTRAEVIRKLRAAQIEQEKQTLATGPRQTVQQYLEYWLQIKEETETIKLSTLISYSSYLKNRVIPIIGQIKLKELSADHIQMLYSQLLKNGISPNTTRLIHTILSTALKDAIKWKRLGANPCKDVTPPRASQHRLHFLTLEQANQLIRAAHDHPMECLIMVAVTTGMRRGELLALRWNDLDLKARTLKIRQSVSYIKVNGRNVFYESEPKTATSRRTVTLPSFVVEALKQHRIKQKEMRLKAGKKWQDNNLVFCTNDGKYYTISTLQRQFRCLLADAGLEPMRFHDLRHSAATILMGMGVNVKVIQELLGHSNISTTLRVYSHVLPGMQRAAMNELDEQYRNIL